MQEFKVGDKVVIADEKLANLHGDQVMTIEALVSDSDEVEYVLSEIPAATVTVDIGDGDMEDFEVFPAFTAKQLKAA